MKWHVSQALDVQGNVIEVGTQVEFPYPDVVGKIVGTVICIRDGGHEDQHVLMVDSSQAIAAKFFVECGVCWYRGIPVTNRIASVVKVSTPDPQSLINRDIQIDLT